MSALRITTAVVDAVVRHARVTAPDECCGMLVGTATLIDEAHAAANVDPRPRTRFVIDPKDHFDAIRAARARGVDVIGFYHSHPRTPAEPSETDRAEAAYPESLHLIVSLVGWEPTLQLFKFVDRNFQAIPFVTVA